MKELFKTTPSLKIHQRERQKVQWCISSVAKLACCLVQVQADYARDGDQLRIARSYLKIINPGRQKPQIFRSEYEKILKEHASLKTAVAGSKEVQILERI